MLDEFFERHPHLVYWVIGGSALGLVRSQSIIPWDSDCDIGVPEEHGNEIFDLLRPFAQQRGHEVWHTKWGLKLFSLTETRAGTDIFYYRECPCPPDSMGIEAKRVLIGDARTQWPNDFFYASEIAQRSKQRFGPVQVYATHNLERYLFSLYGQHCLVKARLAFDHLTNKPHTHAGIDVPLDQVQCCELDDEASGSDPRTTIQ